ncbi:WecB/TagA/CpsF family glycosyltransferase [Tritonibacter scottomollicae]|uniref:WecB/TagA/CpsF family glycosyltransferase n=1 Tax=Tritonibacter scottomollicae TaxID=483013 RepID=UPI003BAC6AF3
MHFLFNNQRIVVNVPDARKFSVEITNRFQCAEGFALATVNLDHLVKLSRDEVFLRAYQAQDFIVADGRPIVWLSRIANRPVELMPGSDLVTPLCKMAAQSGVKVALVGSTESVLEEARTALMHWVPGLEITYVQAPSRNFDPEGDESRQILTELAEQKVGMCFIALGAPKQERFAALGRQLAPQVGFASIGAGLDFVTGAQRRAPLWMRRLALEWLWRMLSSPARLVPRYAQCFAILPRQVTQALRIRRQRDVRAQDS